MVFALHEITKACISIGDQLENATAQACTHSFSNLDGLQGSGMIEEAAEIHLEIVSSVSLNSKLDFSLMTAVSIIGYGSVVHCYGNNGGLTFRNSTNIFIQGITFFNCGSRHDSTSTDFMNKNNTLVVKSALYFIYCTNITLYTVSIEHSDGVGVTVYNSDGLIQFYKCNMTENAVHSVSRNDFAGGGGIRIGITSCPVGTTCTNWRNFSKEFNIGTSYVFEECVFEGNLASTLHEELSSVVSGPSVKQRLGRGGGLYILLGRFSTEVDISIINCRFSGNSAIWGGAVFVSITDSARNNSVKFTNCTFQHNNSTRGDGAMSLSFHVTSKLEHNSVEVKHCYFIENFAPSGGGVGIFTSRKFVGLSMNTIFFVDCHWLGNSAHYGAGLELQSDQAFDQQGAVTLESCAFIGNTVSGLGDMPNQHSLSFRQSVVSVVMEQLNFTGITMFQNNTGTALQAASSVIRLGLSGKLLFINNTGNRGGGLSLVTLSKLLVHSNTQVYFENNQAKYYGGAIYVENLDALDPYLFSDVKCSIQCLNFDIHGCNSSFVFINNSAGHYNEVEFGNSVYFGYVESCVFFCTRNESAANTINNIFKCIGHEANIPEFGEKGDFVSTDRKFEVDESKLVGGSLQVIPGKEFQLPVRSLDGFDNSVFSIYYARFSHLNLDSQIKIDGAYSTVASAIPRLLVYGEPGNNGTLELKSSGYFQYKINIEVTIQPCPPGYSIINQTIETSAKKSEEVRICSCYNQKNFYQGVLCRNDFDGFRTSLRYGYWAGYVVDGSLSESKGWESSLIFFTAICPLAYCKYNCDNTCSVEYRLSLDLPSESIPSVVDMFVCGERRTGILCGSCKADHSVFFHSLRYDCFPDRLCDLGWLFYILSELVPVTVLFLFIITFNISFNTGAVSGFLFFAQTVDSLLINNNYGRDVYFNERNTLWSFQIYQVFYRFFNLDFFGIDKLSFCLWRGATALDVSIIKYVTIAYSFLLVAFTILILNRLNISRYIPQRFSSKGNYVIQGLSAFLTLCYAQCVLVSFQLLFAINLQGIDFNRSDTLHVFYHGDIIFFSRKHLPYAIPALLCLLTFALLPPLVLLWHPLAKQVLTKCKMAESRLVVLVDHLLLVNKLKPVIDSFQSSFKDNCRYFAGLYFIYRVLLLLGLLLVKQSQFYVLVTVFLLLMLLFHSITQPFKKQWYNVLNGFFLAIMLGINVISLSINNSLLKSDDQAAHFIRSILGFQEFLIYIPMCYILIYVAYNIAKIAIAKISDKRREREVEFPVRDEVDLLGSVEYNTLRDSETDL